jgi:hypothetical protein
MRPATLKLLPAKKDRKILKGRKSHSHRAIAREILVGTYLPTRIAFLLAILDKN